MFEVGDLIVYGGEGVCRVEGIGCPDIPAINRERTYYTLAPLYRDGKTYAPVDTTVFMRPVISTRDAQRLIGQIPYIRPNICPGGSVRTLTEHYEEFLKTHDCTDLVQLIRTVYAKGLAATESKKKLGLTDERYRKRAEELLHGELAVALGIPKDDVKAYITEHVKEAEDILSAEEKEEIS